jgi:hypothetical protein
MSIRVRCPKPECNKLLNVPDEAAGKKCRCPNCKSEIRVPAPELPVVDAAEVDEAAFSEKLKPVHKGKLSPAPDDEMDRKPRSSRPRRSREPDEDEERSSRGKRRQRQRDDDLDDDDEGDNTADGKPHPCTPLNFLQFLLGVAFLIGLAFMPILPWITIAGDVEIKNSKESGSMTVSGLGTGTGSLPDFSTGKVRIRTGELAGTGRPEGLLLMCTTLAISLLALILFVTAMTGLLGETGSRSAAMAAILVLVATSVLLLIWQLTWVWKTVTLAEAIRAEADRPQVGLAARTVTSTTRPGLGLYIGMGLAVACAYVFSNLASRVSRTLWCRLAELIGLLLGGLVLLLMVRAWDAQALWDAIQAL